MKRTENAVCRVVVHPEGGIGTGFAVADGSIVVTAAHVLGDADEALLQFTEGHAVKGRLWQRGPLNSDIVLLRVEELVSSVLAVGSGASTHGPLLAWRYGPNLADRNPVAVSVRRGKVVFPPESHGFPWSLLIGDVLDQGMSGGPIYDPNICAAVGVIVARPRHVNSAALASHGHDDEDRIAAALRENDVGYAVDGAVVGTLLQRLHDAAAI